MLPTPKSRGLCRSAAEYYNGLRISRRVRQTRRMSKPSLTQGTKYVRAWSSKWRRFGQRYKNSNAFGRV